MNAQVQKTLDAALKNWNAMAGADHEEAESTANEFESSFYTFIDALRAWVYGLDRRPQTLDELMELPMIQEIVDLLPVLLLLNFETEAELILDNKSRIDEDKYD
jgi:hypothetical protein